MKLRELINEASENIEKAKEWITKNFTEMKVAEMLDDEIPNWVEDDWEEEGSGLDSEFEWYNEYGHGEAEDAVVDQIIKDAGYAIKAKLNVSERLKLNKWIRSKHNLSS